MLLLSLLAAPAVAGEGALVVVSEGDHQVVHEGVLVPAAVDLELEPEDEIVTGMGLFVVALHNGWVVQVEEDLEIRVDELAAYGAEPTLVPVEEQLAAFEDRTPQALSALGERVAGWTLRVHNASRELGGAVPVSRAKKRSATAEGSMFSGLVSPKVLAPPPPAAPAPVGGADDALEMEELAAQPPPPVVLEPAPADPSTALQALFASPEIEQACPNPPKVVKVRVEDGVVVEVRKPTCAEALLLGRPLPGDGWVKVRL